MVNYKLANVVLDNNVRLLNYPGLYYRSANPLIYNKDEEAFLLAPFAQYTFDTYFNALSIKKWHEYADVDNVSLHLEMRGKAEVIFTTIDVFGVGFQSEIVGTESVDADEFVSIDFEYPATDATLLSFRIITTDVSAFKLGYYYTKIDESRIREVHLALSTTTFKKEDYIRANVKLFNEEILGCNDPIADNITMIIVDNGRTLDPAEIESDDVLLFPNKNVGGAGGFARGMIEAKNLDRPATHVLIMDDDISLSSESIKRAFALLGIVNDSYSKAFISGAMFSLGNQSTQIEDVGFARKAGNFGAVKKRMDMAKLENILKNEGDLPRRPNLYAAFWFCCIPMATIEKKGLPLPVFVRFDDAEYGMRCKPKFMTMNGINIWHMDFTDRYNPFYERYCAVRNAFIISATSGVCKEIDFYRLRFEGDFKRELKKFNYGSASLILDGMEDYLKGPEFLEIEQCESILKDKMAKAEKMEPIDNLGLKNLNFEDLEKKSARRSLKKRVLDAVTYNGQRFTPKSMKKKDLAIVKFSPGTYPGSKIGFRSRILEVNRTHQNGYLAVEDTAEFKKLEKRYRELAALYKRTHTDVEERYAAASAHLKSEEFWREYLEIDKYKRK